MDLPKTIDLPLKQDDHGVLCVSDSRVPLDTIIARYHAGDRPEVIHESFDVVPLAAYLQSRCQPPRKIAFIDATSRVIYHNCRIHSHRVFVGIAQQGKTLTGWFFGFKIHLIFNDEYVEGKRIKNFWPSKVLRLFQKNNYPSPAPPRIQGGAIMRTSKFSPRIRGELEGGKIKPVSFSTKASGIVKYLEKP